MKRISSVEKIRKYFLIIIQIPFWSMTDVKGIDKKIFEIIEKNLNQILN